MNHQKINRIANQVGSDILIAATQFLARNELIKNPRMDTHILGDKPFRYRINCRWSKANSNRYPINNCHEMVIDAKQQLYLLTDHPQNNVIVYDREGNVLRSWSLQSKGAHGITLSREGDEEFLWISDPYNARVCKTTLTGRLLQTLPNAHEIGIYAPKMPYLPTQTAVAPNGDIYVADGYGSQFILQFSRSGKYIRHFGGKGSASHCLDFAHGVAIDNRAGEGREILLATSRRESCIKQFSLEGNYLGAIALPGGFPCRPVIVGDKLFVGLCWSASHLNPNSGFVIILDASNNLCATLGGVAERSHTGALVRLQPDYSVFHHVHDVCVDTLGNIYVCEWNAGRVYPLRLEPLT